MPFYSNIGIRIRTESIGPSIGIKRNSYIMRGYMHLISSGTGNLIIENYYPTLYGYK